MLHSLLVTGFRRASRNGQVLMFPEPVATVYMHPEERVVFWPERDANPFFHLCEALWMLAGRRDLAPLVRYVKTFGDFSDDGVSLHGAYGHRWRRAFGRDQLDVVVERLRGDPDDRRCVIQMWAAEKDLGMPLKDVPCNLTATVQVSTYGRLDLVVFCRSNDLVWGAYGANAVHFSMLLEYLSARTGYQIGTYTQISVNLHAYSHTLTPKLLAMFPVTAEGLGVACIVDPYQAGTVRHLPMPREHSQAWDFDDDINLVLAAADSGNFNEEPSGDWARTVWTVLKAHENYRNGPGRFSSSLGALDKLPHRLQDVDWVVAARQWLERRIGRTERGLK
jgi:hypothetical protein